MTWIAPNNFTLAAITGVDYGLGFNPISTFNWNNISALINPLASPFFAAFQSYIGALISGMIIAATYYSNLKWTAYLPINSNQIGEPRLVFALEEQPGPGEKTSIASGADKKLETLLLRSARRSGLEIEKSTAASPSKSLDLGRLQSILINIPAEETLEAQPAADGYHPLGEMLSYALRENIVFYAPTARVP